jgi:hypothetical protein
MKIFNFKTLGQVLLAAAVMMVVELAGCTTQSSQYASKSLYSIIEKPGEDIEGKYVEKELLIYKKWSMNGTESITILAKDIRGELKNFTLILRMNHMNWVFPNSLGLNIDENLLYLKPNDNKRNVIAANNVEETYFFILSKDVIAALANARLIKLQVYKNEVITIDYDGIAAIHNFLQN